MAFVSAKIIARKIWGRGLVTLRLDRSADFAAGQFFNLALHVGTEEVRRSYSAASAPGAPLEFFLSEVAGGQLTPSLVAREPGDSVLLDETPLGFFTLAEVPEARTLWLVATGTGLGPYISMLRQGDIFRRFQRIAVVHGARQASQFAYRDELLDLGRVHPQLTYLPVRSGPDPLPFEGLSGRITSTFASGALEERIETFGPESHMLLCGNPDMITEMSNLLKERGYEKHRRRKAGHFNFEKYW